MMHALVEVDITDKINPTINEAIGDVNTLAFPRGISVDGVWALVTSSSLNRLVLVDISVPTPTPTSKPTPKPTPVPTAKPTPKPTPVPTTRWDYQLALPP